MKKKVVFFIVVMLVATLMICNGVKVKAANPEETTTTVHNQITPYNGLTRAAGIAPQASIMGPIMTFPNIISVNASNGSTTGRIPAEYATLLRMTTQSKYKIVGERMSTAEGARFYTVNTEAWDGNPHYVEISHVAMYEGKVVDVRINVENMVGSSGTRELDIFTPPKVNTANFLHIEFRGDKNNITLRYDFLDHATGKKIPFKGTWIIKRLNSYKDIQLDTRPEFLKSIFAYSNSEIKYTTTTGYPTTIFASSSSSIDTNDIRNQLMFSFDAVDGSLRQTYYPNGSGTRYVYYESVAIAPIEVPHPSILGETNEDYPRVSYHLVQDYPAQVKKESYLKRYKMTVQLDKILKMDKIKYKVTKADGTDVTSLFKMTKDDANSLVYFELSSATLSDANFADNVYNIELESEIDTKVPRDDYVKTDGYFHIPATMKMESDVTNSKLMTAEAKTKYIKGYVDVQYVLEDGKTEIIPTEELVGEIADPYSVSQRDILKHQYIKTIGNTNGFFGKNRQTIQFVYRFIPNIAPKIIFDQQSIEEITYEGTDFKLSGTVFDEDSEAVKVYYILDDGNPVEIANYTQGKTENKEVSYEGLIAKEKLRDGKAHKISVYAEDDEGAKSDKKSVTLKAFVGALQFISAPKKISFGDKILVNSENKTYYVASKEQDLIVQDTRLQKGNWQMGLTVKSNLTSTSGDVIVDAFHYDNQLIRLGQNSKIFEQTTIDDQPVNISKDWINQKKGLNIVIPTSKVKAETYVATLTWTLEDVP